MRKSSRNCYVCLLMVVSLSTGCSVSEANNETESTDTERNETTTEEIIISSEELDSGSETESEYEAITEEDYVVAEVWGDYYTFEEGINMASYVVEARCVNTYSDIQYTYAVFEPLNNIKGEITEETFIIRANKRATVYVGNYIYDEEYTLTYSIDKEYVLVMDRYLSVYNDYDYYTLLGGIYIPKDYIPAAKMFGSGSLYVTANNKECLDAGYDNFIDYIKELVKENPLGTGSTGTDYIRSDRLEDIVAQTDIILRVTVTDHWPLGIRKDREDCYCIVEETLRGKEITGEINVVVPYESVVTGEEYVFLLSKVHETSGFYTMSSKHSVYRWDDTEKVEKIIELIGQSE